MRDSDTGPTNIKVIFFARTKPRIGFQKFFLCMRQNSQSQSCSGPLSRRSWRLDPGPEQDWLCEFWGMHRKNFWNPILDLVRAKMTALDITWKLNNNILPSKHFEIITGGVLMCVVGITFAANINLWKDCTLIPFLLTFYPLINFDSRSGMMASLP